MAVKSKILRAVQVRQSVCSGFLTAAVPPVAPGVSFKEQMLAPSPRG